MATSKIDATALYTIIANTMPTEGRDFTISLAEGADGTQLTIRPLTAVGRGFVPALIENLRQPMKDQGIMLNVVDKANQELVTVNTLRARVEEEAAAKIRAKLDAVREDLRAKEAAAAAATQDRIEKHSRNAPPTAAENTANGAARQAKLALRRLEAIANLIPAVREDIYKVARNQAISDEQNGKSWAVDMDAPLTTLFDKQDALNTFRQREDLLQRLAALEHERDMMRAKAIYATKKFIIPKQSANKEQQP